MFDRPFEIHGPQDSLSFIKNREEPSGNPPPEDKHSGEDDSLGVQIYPPSPTLENDEFDEVVKEQFRRLKDSYSSRAPLTQPNRAQKQADTRLPRIIFPEYPSRPKGALSHHIGKYRPGWEITASEALGSSEKVFDVV
jgi:hypothetical protein